MNRLLHLLSLALLFFLSSVQPQRPSQPIVTFVPTNFTSSPLALPVLFTASNFTGSWFNSTSNSSQALPLLYCEAGLFVFPWPQNSVALDRLNFTSPQSAAQISASFTGLSPSTQYSVTFACANEQGISDVASGASMTPNGNPPPPQLPLSPPAIITTNSMIIPFISSAFPGYNFDGSAQSTLSSCPLQLYSTAVPPALLGSGSFTLSATSVARNISVSLDRSGSYTIRVWCINAHGRTSAVVDRTLSTLPASIPTVPMLMSVPLIVPRRIDLEVRVSSTNGDGPTLSICYFDLLNSTSAQRLLRATATNAASEAIYTVFFSGLIPDTPYNVSVYCTNSLGNSPALNYPFRTLTLTPPALRLIGTPSIQANRISMDVQVPATNGDGTFLQRCAFGVYSTMLIQSNNESTLVYSPISTSTLTFPLASTIYTISFNNLTASTTHYLNGTCSNSFGPSPLYEYTFRTPDLLIGPGSNAKPTSPLLSILPMNFTSSPLMLPVSLTTSSFSGFFFNSSSSMNQTLPLTLCQASIYLFPRLQSSSALQTLSFPFPQPSAQFTASFGPGNNLAPNTQYTVAFRCDNEQMSSDEAIAVGVTPTGKPPPPVWDTSRPETLTYLTARIPFLTSEFPGYSASGASITSLSSCSAEILNVGDSTVLGSGSFAVSTTNTSAYWTFTFARPGTYVARGWCTNSGGRSSDKLARSVSTLPLTPPDAPFLVPSNGPFITETQIDARYRIPASNDDSTTMKLCQFNITDADRTGTARTKLENIAVGATGFVTFTDLYPGTDFIIFSACYNQFDLRSSVHQYTFRTPGTPRSEASTSGVTIQVGGIAGIVIGIVIILGCIGGCWWKWCRRRKAFNSSSTSSATPSYQPYSSSSAAASSNRADEYNPAMANYSLPSQNYPMNNQEQQQPMMMMVPVNTHAPSASVSLSHPSMHGGRGRLSGVPQSAAEAAAAEADIMSNPAMAQSAAAQQYERDLRHHRTQTLSASPRQVELEVEEHEGGHKRNRTIVFQPLSFDEEPPPPPPPED